MLYSDCDKFIKEYLDLLPEISSGTDPEVIVFSHNDVQENNFLYNEADKEIKIIDFEYSSLNYRGMDLASYLNESTINNKVEEVPFYKMDADGLISSFDTCESVKSIFKLYLQTFYEKHLKQCVK